MAFTVEEQRYFKADMDAFDRLPKDVKEAIRHADAHVDILLLKRQAKTREQMVELVRSGKAPR